MTPQQIARKILDDVWRNDEQRWSRYAEAKRADGRSVMPDAPDAACWCVTGAARKVTRSVTDRMAFRDAVKSVIGVPMVGQWQDAPERTFKDVVEVVEQIAGRR